MEKYTKNSEISCRNLKEKTKKLLYPIVDKELWSEMEDEFGKELLL